MSESNFNIEHKSNKKIFIKYFKGSFSIFVVGIREIQTTFDWKLR